MELIGLMNGTNAAKVTTLSLGYWTFTFDGYDGEGRVRVGAGCDYNPLQLVESMYAHVVGGTAHPVGRVETDKDDYDVEFKTEWE